MSSRILPIPTVTQYEAPFCLYACTSMVLSCFGITRSISEIAYEVSLDWPGDSLEAILGELVGAVTDYLADNGLEARYGTDGDWDGIRDHIDRGHPMIVFVKPYADDAQINHAWVIRGYDETGLPAVIYNDPRNDPGSDEPVTFAANHSGAPGETMDYQDFVDGHWSGPPGTASRVYIAVSCKGQGLRPNHRDWRGAGSRSFGRCRYHMARMMRKLRGLELVETLMEGLVSAVAFTGLVVGGFQLIGQALTAGGRALAEIGQGWWAARAIWRRPPGAILVGLAAVIAAAGHVIDAVAGFVGLIIDRLTSLADSVGSVFTGATGASASARLGDTDVNLGLVLKVHPWETRWGDNWEKISGSWAAATAAGARLERLEVRWRVNIWGWGLQSWKLDHRALEMVGTLTKDEVVLDHNGDKTFYVAVTEAQLLRIGFGEGTCRYRSGGAVIRVRMTVEAQAARGEEEVILKKSVSAWGFSA